MIPTPLKTPIFILTMFLIASCSSQKIQIQVQVLKPYCGGAKPTPIQAEGTLYSAAGMSFDLFCIDKGDNEKVKQISLDDNGLWKGGLSLGQYTIKQADKSLSLRALNVKFSVDDTLNYRYIGDKRIEQWTLETDFNFTVVASDILRKDFVLKEKCFVGLNPCLEYIGPKPR